MASSRRTVEATDHRRQCGDAVVEVRPVDGHAGQCRQRARLEGGSRREGQSGPSPLAPRWCGLPERFEETRAEEPERIRDVRSAERFPDPLFSPRAVLVRELRDQRPAHRDGGSALHQLLEVQPVSLRCLQSDGRQRPTVVQVSPETQERSAITLRARRDQDVHCVCDLSADRVDLLLEPVSLLEEVRGQLLVEVQCIPRQRCDPGHGEGRHGVLRHDGVPNTVSRMVCERFQSISTR